MGEEKGKDEGEIKKKTILTPYILPLLTHSTFKYSFPYFSPLHLSTFHFLDTLFSFKVPPLHVSFSLLFFLLSVVIILMQFLFFLLTHPSSNHIPLFFCLFIFLLLLPPVSRVCLTQEKLTSSPLHRFFYLLLSLSSLPTTSPSRLLFTSSGVDGNGGCGFVVASTRLIFNSHAIRYPSLPVSTSRTQPSPTFNSFLATLHPS